MAYHFQGNQIHVPRYAEVPYSFGASPSAPFHNEVQTILDNVEPWENGDLPIEIFELSRSVGARVVELSDVEHPGWGINPHHTAKRPGVSPYFALDDDDPRHRTTTITLELAGSADKPILTRIYPNEGGYMPPLPWMGTARLAPDGGRDACVAYWNRHAFIHRGGVPSLTGAAPDWYRPRQPRS
ncbi:MAG TPA: hypothetical protein VLI54_03900 [Bacillota bacterium]|nr:hypothetical protein [Bacillota bacterium]